MCHASWRTSSGDTKDVPRGTLRREYWYAPLLSRWHVHPFTIATRCLVTGLIIQLSWKQVQKNSVVLLKRQPIPDCQFLFLDLLPSVCFSCFTFSLDSDAAYVTHCQSVTIRNTMTLAIWPIKLKISCKSPWWRTWGSFRLSISL